MSKNTTSKIIRAAVGYCQLQMWQEAWDELETLEPADRALSEVLSLRLGIFIALQRYEAAAVLAEGLIACGDTSPHTWLHGALAIRHCRSIKAARKFLLQAEESSRTTPCSTTASPRTSASSAA